MDKYKDAYIPLFDQLVNFPSYLPKHQPSRTNNIAGANGGSSVLHRHCVMCGTRCLCTALSSTAEAAAVAAALKDETSSDDGSSPSGEVAGGVIIPRQNKGLCTKCDVTVWVVVESSLQIKWCKGCKNYRPWAAFGDKGGATKCLKCRERQKEKYAARKSHQEAKSAAKKRDVSDLIACLTDDLVASSKSAKNRKIGVAMNEHGTLQGDEMSTKEQRQDKEDNGNTEDSSSPPVN